MTLTLLTAAVLGALAIRLWAARAPRPAHLGLADGRLRPCPATPSCVGSEDPSPAHRMAFIPLTGPPDAARERLAAVVEQYPRARIVTADSAYLHAEFRSRLFGFIDDVEFRLDPAAHAIHFRSASRLGRGDLGANRRRMHALAAALR